MTTTRVTREELLEQSVIDFLKAAIYTDRGYPADRVGFMDAFQEDQFRGPLDKSWIAIGFNFDDGGHPLELGSTLIERVYTIEAWVIGRTPDEGRNLANAVRDSVEAQLVPLKDYRQTGSPIIDYLQVDPVSATRQPVPDPRPWQENLYIVHIPVIDQFYA